MRMRAGSEGSGTLFLPEGDKARLKRPHGFVKHELLLRQTRPSPTFVHSLTDWKWKTTGRQTFRTSPQSSPHPGVHDGK